MATILINRRWKWIGHVIRRDQNSITKTALHWAPEGKRKRGRPKTHMETSTSRRGAKVEESLLGNNRKDGQRQTEMKDICSCPTCQWHIIPGSK